jgi:hypothetical protein
MIGLILVCGGFIGAVSQSDAARIAVAVPTKEPQLATAASQTCVTLPTEELLVKETPCEQTFGPSTQPDAAPDPGDGGSE